MPDVSTVLRTALDDEPPLGFAAADIIARARRTRRRRRGLSLAAAGAACAAVVLVAAFALSSGSQARPVHVHLAAWSVDTNSNGTVSVTVRELTHVALLVRALGEARVPAVVTIHSDCLNQETGDALDRSGALRNSPTGVVIRPAAIPSGTAILFGLIPAYASRYWTPSTGWVQQHGNQIVAFGWGLVNTGKTLHCVFAQHDTEYYSTSGTR